MSLAVMVDLETLDVRPTAAILQVGAVLFEPRSGGQLLNNKAFNRFVRLDSNLGTVDHDTLKFWMKDRTSKMLDGMSVAAHLFDVLNDFSQWPQNVANVDWKLLDIYAWPSSFDLPILEHAYSKMGRQAPWMHWRTKDARTLVDALGARPTVDRTGFVEHDALDDAIVQAMIVQKAMRNGQTP